MNTTNLITSIKYYYTTLKNRIKADEPAFFAALKKLAYKVGGSAAAILTANATLTLNLPLVFITILTYVIVVCVAVAGTSKLTTE